LTHKLETTRFQPLSLSSDFLVSKFALSHSTCTATARIAAGALDDPREMVGRINAILEMALPPAPDDDDEKKK
jgi:hypothetical protein